MMTTMIMVMASKFPLRHQTDEKEGLMQIIKYHDDDDNNDDNDVDNSFQSPHKTHQAKLIKSYA